MVGVLEITMITDGKTITEDVSLNPAWSIIKTYGSNEDKDKYKDLHKVTTRCSTCDNENEHICNECGKEITEKECQNQGGMCYGCILKWG